MKTNSKQDILNAFKYEFSHDIDGKRNWMIISEMDWLETKLTEFEREIATQTIREVKDSIDEVYFSANPANSTLTEMDRVEIKANNVAVDHVVNILNLLEKEKRT